VADSGEGRKQTQWLGNSSKKREKEPRPTNRPKVKNCQFTGALERGTVRTRKGNKGSYQKSAGYLSLQRKKVPHVESRIRQLSSKTSKKLEGRTDLRAGGRRGSNKQLGGGGGGGGGVGGECNFKKSLCTLEQESHYREGTQRHALVFQEARWELSLFSDGVPRGNPGSQ